MAKRVNRLKSIHHEISQLDMIKDLKPNATPPEALPLSDALVDVAQEALREVAKLEDGQPSELIRLQTLMSLIDSLPDKVD